MVTNVFIWFFEGLNGLGGWLALAGLALLAVIFVFANSSARRLPAIGWRWGVTLASLFLLPAAVHHFLPEDLQETLLPFKDIIFYAGSIGGVLPVVMALGYLAQYAGMVVCEHGHVYRRKQGECPECIPEDFVDYDPSELDETILDFGVAEEDIELDPFAEDDTVEDTVDETSATVVGGEEDTEFAEREFFDTEMGRVGMPPKVRPKANAFLLFPSGESCQLNQGSTSIGRGSGNDFIIQNTFVSRAHAKIMEESRNLFRLYDLGSSNGTWLNGRKLMKATLLENDDVIRFGEEVTVVFLSSRKI